MGYHQSKPLLYYKYGKQDFEGGASVLLIIYAYDKVKTGVIYLIVCPEPLAFLFSSASCSSVLLFPK